MAVATKSEVLSVIQNWRRPDNVRRVVEAVRQQTVASFLAIVDCAAGTEWQLPPDVTARADVVFTVQKQNLGPCCRFIPSCVLPHIPLTMFWLDDYLPGPRCLESFLRHRVKVEQSECATLGQDGRVIDDMGRIVRRRRIPAAGELQEVWFITSAEMCRTGYVSLACTTLHLLAEKFGDSISLDEDDLLLCLGIGAQINAKSLVFGIEHPDESYRVERLPSPDALSARPDHDVRRNRFIELLRTSE